MKTVSISVTVGDEFDSSRPINTGPWALEHIKGTIKSIYLASGRARIDTSDGEKLIYLEDCIFKNKCLKVEDVADDE